MIRRLFILWLLRKSVETLSKNVLEIILTGEWTETTIVNKEAKRFLLFDESFVNKDGQTERSVCFALKILSQSDQWHSDATFKSASAGFFQLFIIHGYYKQNMCPSVFLIMSRKLFESYKFVLEKLILAALNLEIQFNPKAIFSDFEISLIKSFRSFGLLQRLKDVISILTNV